MTILYIILCEALFLLAACKVNNHHLPAGLWRLEKIEVLKNNELKKIIDTGYQYWKFYKTDSIEISNEKEIQKCLRIKAGNDSFRSIDGGTGDTIDEFFIEKLNKHELELSSKKKLDQIDYKVVYYLQKMTGAAETEVKKSF